MLSIIVAIAEDGAIGAKNALLWRLPNDMKRFRELTTGHTVVMGRKTFESLPNGALPNRWNVVISSNIEAVFENAIVYSNVHEAIQAYRDEYSDAPLGTRTSRPHCDDELFIIGGSSIYRQTIDLADRLYITRVHHRFDDADAFFPNFSADDWVLTEQISFPKDEKHGYPYTFQTYIKNI